MKTPKNLLKIGNKEYNFVLTMSVIEDLQEKYSDLGTALKTLDNFTSMPKELAEIATIFINNDIDNHNDECPDKWEKVNSDWVKRKIAINSPSDGMVLAVDLSMAILNALKLSMPESENEDPNLKTTE